jgi:hypothetical protein
MAKANVYQQVQTLMASGKAATVKEACRALSVSPTTYYSQRKKEPKQKKTKMKMPTTVPYAEAPAESGKVVALVGTPAEIGRALAGLGAI